MSIQRCDIIKNSTSHVQKPSNWYRCDMNCLSRYPSLHFLNKTVISSFLQVTKPHNVTLNGNVPFLRTCVFRRLLDIVDCVKDELVILVLAILVQVRTKKSTLVSSKINDPDPWTSTLSTAVRNMINSPKAEMCFQHMCLMFNRLHLQLIDPLLSLKTFNIKGSAPGGGAKAIVGEPGDLIYVVLGWSGDVPAQSIEMYDPRTQAWSYFQEETPCTRAYHGTALHNNEIYAIGGFNGHRCQSTTLSLNMQTGIWSRKCSMSMPRCYVAIVVLKGLIYAIGGHNGVHRLKSCEVYHPKRNRWASIASMMFRRSDAGATELNGRIYVCGGFDGFNFHASTEVYNPEVNQWALVTSLINARSGHSLATLDGFLFAMGGFNGTERMHDVEKYNVENNTWESFIPMTTGRSNFCTTVLQGQIFAIGGYDGSNTTSKVEKLNLPKGSWESVPDMRLHRSAAGACVRISGGNSAVCALNDFGVASTANIEEPSP